MLQMLRARDVNSVQRVGHRSDRVKSSSSGGATAGARGQCSTSTGGRCSAVKWCPNSLGPTKSCGVLTSYKCECETNYCWVDGACRNDFDAYVAAVNQDHPSFPHAHNHVTRALCFSGGGSRAMIWTMGALRALEDLGLMSHVDAISAVSGGTWASSVYMFADLGKNELLGAATSPGALTLEALREPPAAMGAALTRSSRAFILDILEHGLPQRHELWQRYIGRMILQPFGLDDDEAYLAPSAGTVARIKEENPQLRDAAFLTPRPQRPEVFVMNGVLLAPVGYAYDSSTMVSLQMGPDYTGSPFWPGGRSRLLGYKPEDTALGLPSLRNITVGGGLVESFAYGGGKPYDAQHGGSSEKMPAPQLPLSLAKAVSVSSNDKAAQLYETTLGLAFVVPIALSWPVMPKGPENEAASQAREYMLSDGGHLENSGLLAMLQRGATKVAMWVSTRTALSTEVNFCRKQGQDWDAIFASGNYVDPVLSDKFGFSYSNAPYLWSKNTVFEREQLLPLLCELQKLRRAGKATVHLGNYNVQPNSWWGIAGGYEVQLLVVYLDQCKDFEAALPAATRLALGAEDTANRTQGEFARFPRYNTAFQASPTDITKVTASQVNLLAAQSEWFVRQNEALFRRILS